MSLLPWKPWRAAASRWGLMAWGYGVGYAPALTLLDIEGYDSGSGKLLLFLVVVVQASDVLQFVWGKLVGRRRIAPVGAVPAVPGPGADRRR